MTGRAPSKRAVLIAGATASGKSALALALAEQLGGENVEQTDSAVADNHGRCSGLNVRRVDGEPARAHHVGGRQ